MTEERWVDPIVEEVHRIRQEYSARFNHDISAMFEDARKNQEESRKQGWVILSAPLRQPESAADQSVA